MMLLSELNAQHETNGEQKIETHFRPIVLCHFSSG